METYTFVLTEVQANIILQALAVRPYAEVFDLIAEIQRQAGNQAETPSPLSSTNADR